MPFTPGAFPKTPTSFDGPYPDSEGRLPTGQWHMMANGRIFLLDILKVTGADVTARFSSGDIKNVCWDAETGILTFTRVVPLPPGEPLQQAFTGYLLHFDAADPLWRIAGIFGDQKIGPQSGWYATLPRSEAAAT